MMIAPFSLVFFIPLNKTRKKYINGEFRTGGKEEKADHVTIATEKESNEREQNWIKTTSGRRKEADDSQRSNFTGDEKKGSKSEE